MGFFFFFAVLTTSSLLQILNFWRLKTTGGHHDDIAKWQAMHWGHDRDLTTA